MTDQQQPTVVSTHWVAEIGPAADHEDCAQEIGRLRALETAVRALLNSRVWANSSLTTSTAAVVQRVRDLSGRNCGEP